jgi:hypothetical protein
MKIKWLVVLTIFLVLVPLVSARELDWENMKEDYIQVDVSDYSFIEYQKFINKNKFVWDIEYEFRGLEDQSLLVPHRWTDFYGDYRINGDLSFAGQKDDIIGHKKTIHKRWMIIPEEICTCLDGRPYCKSKVNGKTSYELWTETLVYSKSRGMCWELKEGDSITHWKIENIYIRKDRIKQVYLPKDIPEPRSKGKIVSDLTTTMVIEIEGGDK